MKHPRLETAASYIEERIQRLGYSVEEKALRSEVIAKRDDTYAFRFVVPVSGGHYAVTLVRPTPNGYTMGPTSIK